MRTSGSEVLPLKLGDLRGTRKQRYLGAACALGLACACLCATSAIAQTSVNTDKAASNKPVSPKKHAKAAAKASGTTSAASKRKAHPASHPAAGSHAKSNAASASHPPTTKHASARKKKKTARGQQKIDSDRAQEIQEALVREHYLIGEASGQWDQASEDAMRRYQADHGWQSKTVPDSRALISLGLGPSHDHLLNPESAMTTGPFPPRGASLTPTSHSADPGARMNGNPAVPAGSTSAESPDHDGSSPQ
jgi:hypothetical protein